MKSSQFQKVGWRSRPLRAVVASLVLSMPGCRHAAPVGGAPSTEPAVATSTAPDGTGVLAVRGDPALERFLERSFEELGLVPGMSVAVVRDSAVLLLRGFGVADISSNAPVTAETPFYIASSTKSFVGTAAAILAERGVWNLDDPLSRWLPDLRLPSPLSADAITLRDLLTHTSRIENGSVIFRTAFSGEHDRATLLSLLDASDVLEPGFDYGNIGYVIASLAMDSAAGRSWKDVLEHQIFTPLGMRGTSAYRSDFDGRPLALPHGVALGARPFEVRPYIKVDDNMHAAGGMITTAADLARWLLANLNDGRIGRRQAIPAAALREALRKHVDTDARFHEFHRTGYGLGWYHSRYEGELVIHHFGNYPGFRAHVSFMPEHGIGVAVMTNESSQGYFVPEFVATSVYDRLLGRSDLEARYDSAAAFLVNDAERVRAAVRRDAANRAQRPDTLALPPSTYTGSYYNRLGGTMVVDESGFGRLEVRIGLLRSLAEPVNDTDLVRVELVPGSGEQIRFFLGAERAESLQYSGEVFRRR